MSAHGALATRRGRADSDRLDRLEDQYTSATADLSAGGVAAAFESIQENPHEQAQSAPVEDAAFQPHTDPTTAVVPAQPSSLAPAMPLAGAVLVAGGVGAVWL